MRSFFTLASIVTIAPAQPFGFHPLPEQPHTGWAPTHIVPEQNLIWSPDHQKTGPTPPLQCPSGFTLTGKKCEKLIFLQPQIHCALGQLVGEQCITRVPLLQQCPIGSMQEGKECLVLEAVQPDSRCPPEYQNVKDTCVKKIPAPVTEVCDIGHDDGSGECVQLEHAQKVIRTFCPPGFFDEGKGCMRITEYDCSPPIVGKAAAPVPLPLLPFGKKNKKNGYPRMLGAKKFNVYAPLPVAIPPPSKAMVVPAPPPPPPSKVQVIRQSCQRKDFAPPVVESYCPEGFTEMGKKCQRIAKFPRIPRCSVGGDPKDCYEIKTTPKKVTCPKGVLIGGNCQYKQPVPKETVCPAGTHQNGKECEQITIPLVHCPQGTTLEGRQCLGRETAEPTGLITIPCTGKGCWNH